jgi:release factor glutamine methyltransferase
LTTSRVAIPDGCLTVEQALGYGEEILSSRHLATPRLDAELLLGHLLGADRCQLIRDGKEPLVEHRLAAFERLLGRRAKHEPVAYLVGTKEFWSMSLKVDRRVLLPRPDSEALVEMVQALFDSAPPDRFADVGCGSGCLACALASVFDRATGVAIDRDEGALQVTRENLRRYDLTSRVVLRQGDLLEPIGDEKFDLICANLPYVPTGELSKLPPQVRLFEPLGALDGGPDGLSVICRLIESAPVHLVPGGWLVLEVGDDQAQPVGKCCVRSGFARPRFHRDLAGQDRVVGAQWT